MYQLTRDYLVAQLSPGGVLYHLLACPQHHPCRSYAESRGSIPVRVSGADAFAPHRDLAGFPAELVDDVQLCASELFANAVNHTVSGAPGGQVVRSLSLPAADRLRLEVTDSGLTPHRPRIPDLSGTARFTAEHHRGLLLVSALALDWGYRPAVAHPPSTWA